MRFDKLDKKWGLRGSEERKFNELIAEGEAELKKAGIKSPRTSLGHIFLSTVSGIYNFWRLIVVGDQEKRETIMTFLIGFNPLPGKYKTRTLLLLLGYLHHAGSPAAHFTPDELHMLLSLSGRQKERNDELRAMWQEIQAANRNLETGFRSRHSWLILKASKQHNYEALSCLIDLGYPAAGPWYTRFFATSFDILGHDAPADPSDPRVYGSCTPKERALLEYKWSDWHNSVRLLKARGVRSAPLYTWEGQLLLSFILLVYWIAVVYCVVITFPRFNTLKWFFAGGEDTVTPPPPCECSDEPQVESGFPGILVLIGYLILGIMAMAIIMPVSLTLGILAVLTYVYFFLHLFIPPMTVLRFMWNRNLLAVFWPGIVVLAWISSPWLGSRADFERRINTIAKQLHGPSSGFMRRVFLPKDPRPEDIPTSSGAVALNTRWAPILLISRCGESANA